MRMGDQPVGEDSVWHSALPASYVGLSQVTYFGQWNKMAADMMIREAGSMLAQWGGLSVLLF
jgi:hypothetical protein